MLGLGLERSCSVETCARVCSRPPDPWAAARHEPPQHSNSGWPTVAFTHEKPHLAGGPPLAVAKGVLVGSLVAVDGLHQLGLLLQIGIHLGLHSTMVQEVVAEAWLSLSILLMVQSWRSGYPNRCSDLQLTDVLRRASRVTQAARRDQKVPKGHRAFWQPRDVQQTTETGARQCS